MLLFVPSRERELPSDKVLLYRSLISIIEATDGDIGGAKGIIVFIRLAPAYFSENSISAFGFTGLTYIFIALSYPFIRPDPKTQLHIQPSQFRWASV